MLGHHPLDILIVLTLENVPQLISVVNCDFRFLPDLSVSSSAYNLRDRWQTAFCNLDNLRAEGSPNRLRDVIAGTNESLESAIYAAEIGFGLSQSGTGACYLPSPIPNHCGDPCRSACHDKDQRKRVDLNTSNEPAEEQANLPK